MDTSTFNTAMVICGSLGTLLLAQIFADVRSTKQYIRDIAERTIKNETEVNNLKSQTDEIFKRLWEIDKGKLVSLLIIICLLLSFGACAQVTRKEVQAAKIRYINEKKDLLMLKVKLSDSLYCKNFNIDSSDIFFFDGRTEQMRLDSLYFEGLRAIRKDQLTPKFFR